MSELNWETCTFGESGENGMFVKVIVRVVSNFLKVHRVIKSCNEFAIMLYVFK